MALDEKTVSVFVSGQNSPDHRVVVIPHSRIGSDQTRTVRKNSQVNYLEIRALVAAARIIGCAPDRTECSRRGQPAPDSCDKGSRRPGFD
jgi:hypothetical protein